MYTYMHITALLPEEINMSAIYSLILNKLQYILQNLLLEP